MPIAAGLIVAAAAGLIKTGVGLSEKNAAESDLAGAVRPNYVIPREWYDNAGILGSEAETGLTAPARDYYRTQADRGFSGGIGATLEAGGNVNNIADLYDAYNQGNQRIAEEDSRLKNENIKNFIEANSNLANERDKAWTLNEYQPYEQRVKADNQKAAAGQQTAFNGADDVTNALTAYNTSKLYGENPANTETMGGKNGLDTLDAGQAQGAGAGADMAIAPSNAFATQGGQAAITDMARRNPNSPYMAQILRQLRGQQGYAPAGL